MKKITIIFIVVFAMFFVWSGAVPAAEWYLYDQFDDGSGGGPDPIDTNRWDIHQPDSNISISVVNGQASFEHIPSSSKSSAFLVFNQSPESIKAVRVLVGLWRADGLE